MWFNLINMLLATDRKQIMCNKYLTTLNSEENNINSGN